MKNTHLITGLAGLMIFISVAMVSAQESTTLQFMKGISQSDLQNPALHNDSSKVVINLPGLSGLYVDFNSGFALNDLIHKGTGSLSDSLVLDLNTFHSKLDQTNTFQQHFSMPLFYLRIKSKKSFFSFGITEKQMAKFSFNKDLVTFLKEGNAPYMGKSFDLGGIDIDAYHYREFAFGYSHELLNKKLTVGAKAKILYGKMALQTEKMNLKVETAPDGSYINLSTDMKANISGPVTPQFDQDGFFESMNSDNIEAGNYLMEKGNMGLAFDLGAVFKLTPKIVLSGSIDDLGKISFKKNITSLTHAATFKWEGIDFSKSLDNSKADYVDPADLFDAEREKLKSTIMPKKSEIGSQPFDLTLPTKINLGGTYALNRNFNLGILNRFYSFGGISRNTLTVSANALLGNFFSLTGSYSMIGASNNNFGLGVALRLGFMQLYVVSDNLMALNDPAKAEYVNARFGMNILFGRKHN